MKQLIKLQDIDTKLKDLNDLLGDLPSKVEELDKKEQSIKNTLVKSKSRLKELEVEFRKKENNISQNNEKIAKLKDQLFLVTNNKQYDALMVEIDHLKDQRSNFETESINLLDEKEMLIETVNNMESDLGDLSKDLISRKGKLESAIAESAEQKRSLEGKRKEKIDIIDENILSIYKRVIKARNGIAVVQLEGSGCGGCGAHIPPQTVTEVRAESGIHRCDMCGRFLYNQKISVN